jgi:hypothetical protein
MDRLSEGVFRTQRWLIIAIAVQLVLVAGMLRVDGLFEHVGMDYLTSYTAAEIIRDGAFQDLYDTRVQWEYQRPVIAEHGVDWGDRIMHPYIAPPLLGILSIPLLALGPALAYAAWALLNAAAVGLGIWLVAKRFAVDWTAPLVVLAGSLPLFMVLMLGQVEGLLFLAFVIFLIAIRDGRDVRAGLALAVFAIKPPLMLAPMLYLAVTGRRRATWTAIAATAVQAVGSMLLVGPGGVRDYIALSQRLSGPDGTTVTNVWGMVNLRSVVVRAVPADEPTLTNLMIVLLTGMTLAVACWFWRRAATEPVMLPSLALLAVTTVLTSYHALYHTATLALLGVILLIAYAHSQHERLRAEWLTIGSWVLFSLLPLLAFIVVQTSQVPAAIGVAGVLVFWAVAAGTVAQQVAATEAATRPSRSELQPWYVIERD